jgi:hypothetical protein
MMRNSLICKLINVPASMKENNEKNIKKEDEISKLIKLILTGKESYVGNLKSEGVTRLLWENLFQSGGRFHSNN